MALVLADRVQETSTSVGTGTFTLAGAVNGFQSFAVIGNANTTYYVIAGGNEWEVGIGTYTSSGTTLSRDTVLSSSNSNAKVDFSAGVKYVFVSYPEERAVYVNGTSVVIPNSATVPIASGGTGATTLAGANIAVTNTSNTFTTNQIISANSSSDALRITQTGAGNALVVEDSANPDATPFVVDANGSVISGSLTNYTITGTTAKRIQSVSTGGDAGFSSSYWANNTSGTTQQMMKSRGATVGDYTIVQNGDTIGQMMWGGSDGTAFIQAASIIGVVDGIPGTNDMPGRLVFSTTADGASSPTERMRIDSAGNVGIGGTAAAYVKQHLLGTYPSSSNITQAIRASGTIPSTSTTSATIFQSIPTTQAASFTCANLYHFGATQQTFGAGSSVTTQAGFVADSTLTGATNNYGFYSNIASGTGRWNFYSAGTAASYFGGDVQFKKAIIEEVYTITDGAAFEIDPSNGTMQLITLGASRTPKATNFSAGESVILMVDDGTAYTLTWTDATFGGSGVVWKTNAGVAPTLNTTGYTAIVLWKVGTQVYGARVGDA